MTALDNTARNRNRQMLLALAAIFFGGMLVAGLLRFSGWKPAGTRNHGEMLEPMGDLRTLVPRLADGSEYHWNPVERKWRVLVAPPARCAAACVKLADELDLVWQLFGKDADHVDILWLGAPPHGARSNAATRILRDDAALRAQLPRVDGGPGEVVTGDGEPGVPVYIIDPNGFVILRYPPGFDPGGLRADMAKLLKLL